MVAENAPKTAGRRFALWQSVQEDVYEKLATSKLDDDVKISVVLREAPTKLRDNLLVNSQQFESNCNKLRAIIQAYLNTNKNWTAHDFRNYTKESDPNATAMAKAEAKERSLTTKTKSATCVERNDTSREIVGHEQTKTEQ